VQQVRKLLTAASRHPTLRFPVLPAVTTALRRGDIETIRMGDVHFCRRCAQYSLGNRVSVCRKQMSEKDSED